jgi:hypothetical protein
MARLLHDALRDGRPATKAKEGVEKGALAQPNSNPNPHPLTLTLTLTPTPTLTLTPTLTTEPLATDH